jgi:protein-tyrosine phosphatase
MGIYRVINLLDDEELLYLGVPWSEYEEEAHLQNVQVFRYPMVEGMAPPLAELESFRQTVVLPLEQDIQAGRNVLCHCRGGIFNYYDA